MKYKTDSSDGQHTNRLSTQCQPSDRVTMQQCFNLLKSNEFVPLYLPKLRKTKSQTNLARIRTQYSSNVRVQLSTLISGITTQINENSASHNDNLQKSSKLSKTNHSFCSKSKDDTHKYKLIKLRTKPSRCIDNYIKPIKQKIHIKTNTLLSKPTTNITQTQTPQSKLIYRQVIQQKKVFLRDSPKRKNTPRALIKNIIEPPFKIWNQIKNRTPITKTPQMSIIQSTQIIGLQMTPCQQIDDFNEKLFGGKTMRTLINSQKTLPKQKKYTNQKDHYKCVRIALIQMLHYLQKLKLNPKELIQFKVFTNRPYEHPDSKTYFNYCKSGKNDLLQIMLDKNKYFVYEYDNLFMTTLHWCAIRGLLITAAKLLKYGADPDAQDIVGRTPLYLALQNNQNEIAQLLLVNKADPWNKTNLDYNDAVIDNVEGQNILSSSRKMRILLRMTPPSQREYIWRKEQLQMYIDPSIRQEDL